MTIYIPDLKTLDTLTFIIFKVEFGWVLRVVVVFIILISSSKGDQPIFVLKAYNYKQQKCLINPKSVHPSF